MNENGKDKSSKNIYKMGLMGFVLVTLCAIMSIRNFPSMALVQWQLIAFSILAIILYLIPASLTSAELATGWPKTGGVYLWVKEAFGERWGFTAVWLQWFQMTIGFVGVLSFVAATFAYAINPALANNKLYEFLVIIIVWWVFTFLNFRGLKTYTRISSLFVSIGVLIPSAILIICGLWYVFSGQPVAFTLTPTLSDFIPDFSNINNISLLVTFVFLFIGVEMTAVHSQEIKNVGKNYPLGLLIMGVILVAISIIGSLLVMLLVPAGATNLLSGIMQAFEKIFGLGIITSIIALMITIGAVGQASSWILGPVRGLLVTAQDGNLPKILQKENKNKMPVNMMILQAVIITFWGIVYVVLPGGVNSSFWMLFALTTTIYIVMYLFMYAALIKLRYSQPKVPRSFTIPGGKAGAWIVGAWGFIAMVFLFVVALFPPSQISGSGLTSTEYIAFLLLGTIITTLIPVIIHALRKPSWKPESWPDEE
jgi:amino acid transporter